MRIGIVAAGCAILTVICPTSVATAKTSWWRTYGGTDYDDSWSVQQTSDGGYIIAGSTSSFGAGSYDVYLIRTDAAGDTLWTRTYGGTSDDEGYSVQQTSDGGYIVVGQTKSFGAGDFDIYLIKTDASGDTLWTRAYGGANRELSHSVLQASDDGYVITGFTQSFGSGATDVYLIGTDAAGDTLWTKTYGGTLIDGGNSIQLTSDGGYIIAGYTASFGAEECDVYLIKTDAQGDTLWTKTYGGSRINVGYSVQQASDGGYIIAGYTNSFGAGGFDVYMIRTDASGNALWMRIFGGASDDEGWSVQQTSGGGYIIAGYTFSLGAGLRDLYLVKVSALGDILWTKTYGGSLADVGISVQQTSDGGFITAGATSSFGAGNYDVYLIKTDSLGSVGVAEESPKPQVTRDRIGPTVLSGTSGVRQLASCVAFDATGRRVHHPAPGIYFVQEAQAQAQAQAVRKVLLVR